MGRRLIALIAEADDLRLAGAAEQDESPALGQDAGELAGIGKLGLPVSREFPPEVGVVVDFSSPEGTLAALRFCCRHRKPIVIGTTGLGDEERARVASAAKHIPCLFSPNMSVAMNLLFRLAGEVAEALGGDYDAEIIETHHRFKKDAPSGTALKLAESIAAARGLAVGDVSVFGRQGKPGERRREEIGIHAVRAGDIVGEHTIIFSSLGERLELVHRAHTRDCFAQGALAAARFLVGRPPGLYSMADLLHARSTATSKGEA
jgi:4-hydroxy-tetrahydrodipicolinate reductase